MIKNLLIISFLMLLGGCSRVLTPYDNEFICKPSMIGSCGKSIKENYRKELDSLDKSNK